MVSRVVIADMRGTAREMEVRPSGIVLHGEAQFVRALLVARSGRETAIPTLRAPSDGGPSTVRERPDAFRHRPCTTT